MKTQLILAVSLIATAMTTGAAMAEEHEVQMLNRGPNGDMMVFEPAYLEISVTYTTEGVYGVKCLPHYGLGMVALIKVGDGEAPNLGEAAAVRHPGRANQRFHQLFEQVEAGTQ